MIIALFGGRCLKVSEEIAQKVDSVWMPKEHRKIRIQLLNEEKVTFDTSTIEGIWSDEQWDVMEHEKAGDWRCHSEHWHKKNETFCNSHVTTGTVEAAPWLREKAKPAAEARTSNEKYKRIIQVNMQYLRLTGKYGTLRSLGELDAYDETGAMPEVATPLVDLSVESPKRRKQAPVFPGVSA